MVFISHKRTVKLFFWNNILWMLDFSCYLNHLSLSPSQKCRFYSPKWNLLPFLPTTSNPMCYTHIQISLQKSWDDYFKQTIIFTKLKIKSQVLKSITPIKIPQHWLLYAPELWFWIYFMISAQLFFVVFFFFNTNFSGSWLWCNEERYFMSYVAESGWAHFSRERGVTFLFFPRKHFPKTQESAGTSRREIGKQHTAFTIRSRPEGSL